MARSYVVAFDRQTVASASGDYELVELDPATDKPIEIYYMEFGVFGEIGEEERYPLIVIRGHATDGTGGSSVTPRPLNGHDAAAGFTADILRTAIATGGTALNMPAGTFDVRAGYQWGPFPPTEGIRCSADEGLLVVRLSTGVTDDISLSGTVLVREL